MKKIDSKKLILFKTMIASTNTKMTLVGFDKTGKFDSKISECHVGSKEQCCV